MWYHTESHLKLGGSDFADGLPVPLTCICTWGGCSWLGADSLLAWPAPGYPRGQDKQWEQLFTEGYNVNGTLHKEENPFSSEANLSAQTTALGSMESLNRYKPSPTASSISDAVSVVYFSTDWEGKACQPWSIYPHLASVLSWHPKNEESGFLQLQAGLHRAAAVFLPSEICPSRAELGQDFIIIANLIIANLLQSGMCLCKSGSIKPLLSAPLELSGAIGLLGTSNKSHYQPILSVSDATWQQNHFCLAEDLGGLFQYCWYQDFVLLW